MTEIILIVGGVFLLLVALLLISSGRGARVRAKNIQGNIVAGDVKGPVSMTYKESARSPEAGSATSSSITKREWIGRAIGLPGALAALLGLYRECGKGN